MKLGQTMKSKLGVFLLFSTSLCAFFALSVFSRADAQDNNAASAKVIATISVSGTDEIWNGAERVADVMKYKDLVAGVRGLVKARAKIDLFDPSKPFSVAIATDGVGVSAFGYLPLANPDAFDESAANALKANISELDKNGLFKGDFFVLNGALVIGKADQKELIASIPESEYKPEKAQDGTTTLVRVNVNFDALPKELVEAGAAVLRQKLAELVEEEDSDELQSIDHALSRYSELVYSLDRIEWSLNVDADANLVSDLVLTADPESKLAASLAKSAETQTRWNVVNETANAIVASAEAGDYSDQSVKGDVENVRKAVHDNLLNSLDVLIDDPESFDVAKEIVAHVEEALVADLQSGTSDCGFAISSEPLCVVLGASSATPNEFKEAVDKLIDRLKKTESELADAFTTEQVEDYAVTTFELPLNDVSDDLPPFLADRKLAVKLGTSSDAILFVAALDPEHAADEFKRVAVGSKEKAPQTNTTVFDVAQLAVALRNVLETLDNVRPQAAQSVEAFVNAQDAKIVFTRTIEGNVVKAQASVHSGFFKTLGDVLRINLMGGNGDEGEDVDDLFDDEEGFDE